MDIRIKIRAMMDERGLTTYALAQKSGLSVACITNWQERGYEPSLHYYHLKDIEINSSHESLFRALYVEPNQSYDLIAKRFYINVYTLDRYRQQYNRFALKIAPRKLVAKYQAILGSV